MTDYYRILNVARDADEAVITAAYRALARKLHPDTAGQNADPARFALVTEAHGVLSDPLRRAEYDRLVAQDALPVLDTRKHADLDAGVKVQPIEVPSAAMTSDETLVGNFFWLILGIPIAYVLGIVLADMLFRWLLTVAGSWIGSGSYSLSEAIDTAGEIIRATLDDLQSDGARPVPTNYIVVAFGAGWFFVCSSAAAGAIVDHSADERPRLPVFLVYASLLATWGATCLLTYHRVQGLEKIGVVDGVAGMLGLLAGILTSRSTRSRHATAGRSRADKARGVGRTLTVP